MRTVAQILEELSKVVGGASALSRELGLSPSAVPEMARRGSVHSKYFPKIEVIAKRCGLDWVTPRYLALAHAAEAGLLPVAAVPEPPIEAAAATLEGQAA